MKREWVLGWEAKLLVMVTSALVVVGLVSVYSVSSAHVEGGRQVGAVPMLVQLSGAVLGALALLVAARVNLERVRRLAWPFILVAALLLLVLVMPGTGAIAPRIHGARRWLDIGVSIQVSELAKLAIVIWTAMLCAKKGTEVRRLSKGLLPVLVVAAPIAGLIMLQPDLSTAVWIPMLAMIILFVAGARIGHFILLGFLAVPILWKQIESMQYAALRLTTFLDPGTDPRGATYQIDQALIATGSGGLLGVGFGQGHQKLGYLPYPTSYSDFIFASIAEEWGFAGVVIMVGLYLTYVLIALRLARAAGDPFRQYLGVGLAVMIGADAFVHMAVNIGLVPTTGLVLPFVSYGRSGLVTAMIATGLLINLGSRRRQVLQT